MSQQQHQEQEQDYSLMCSACKEFGLYVFDYPPVPYIGLSVAVGVGDWRLWAGMSIPIINKGSLFVKSSYYA